MCGIIGYISPNKSLDAVERAAEVQTHRGPDARATSAFQIGRWHVHFAHQRLSVIDLSEGANQPFQDDGNEMIFNGEVYNYLEIREELTSLGATFTTESDTEVVFRAISQWGIDEAAKRFNGMWSIAFFDRAQQRLLLSRDRFGIKPLYYTFENDRFFFASEIKTLLALSQNKQTLNLQTVGLYLEQHLLESDTEQTFFENILKLKPGHNASMDLSNPHLKLNHWTYYTLKLDSQFSALSTEEAATIIKEKLNKSVHLRLRSDVPVGVLLSGGLDSSSIAAITNKAMEEKTQLLSYVSDDKDVDESPFIDIMAQSLGREVKKVKLKIDTSRVFELLKKVTYFNDQPLHSFSAVAHFLLMEQAKLQNLTVILSGQGADESLCGYRKYVGFYVKSLLSKNRVIAAARVLWGFLLNGTLLSEFSFVDGKRYLPKFLRGSSPSIITDKVRSQLQPAPLGLSKHDSLESRQIKDILRFSVPSLLHYEDRMSMAHSREIRVPFLDHELVECLISLKPQLKLYKGWTKYGLRLAMRSYLPKSICWRKDKKGFSNPQKQWLKNDLSASILDIFQSENAPIYRYQLVDRDVLLEKYKTYCGARKHSIADREIFSPLALNLWLESLDGVLDKEKECIL